MDQCSIRVGAGTAPIIILMITRVNIGLPLILLEEVGPTKRKMLLIHMVTFSFGPNRKEKLSHLYLPEVIHVSAQNN